MRLLRVDLGYEILEKDAEAGYVLFEITEAGKTFRGSLEVVKLHDRGTKRVRVIVHIADQPSYVERSVLSKLQTKLRAEYGAPPKQVKPQPEPDKPAPGAKLRS